MAQSQNLTRSLAVAQLGQVSTVSTFLLGFLFLAFQNVSNRSLAVLIVIMSLLLYSAFLSTLMQMVFSRSDSDLLESKIGTIQHVWKSCSYTLTAGVILLPLFFTLLAYERSPALDMRLVIFAGVSFGLAVLSMLIVFFVFAIRCMPKASRKSEQATV